MSNSPPTNYNQKKNAYYWCTEICKSNLKIPEIYISEKFYKDVGFSTKEDSSKY